MKNNGYYECNNCSKEMKKEIIFMANWQQLLQSKRDISQYFERKNGYCEE